MTLRSDAYGICGHSAASATDGLASTLHISPGAGADWFAVYFHSEEVKKLRDQMDRFMAERDLWKRRALEYGERLARDAIEQLGARMILIKTTGTSASLSVTSDSPMSISTQGWCIQLRPRRWKQVYRSRGRGRGKRPKWILR